MWHELCIILLLNATARRPEKWRRMNKDQIPVNNVSQRLMGMTTIEKKALLLLLILGGSILYGAFCFLLGSSVQQNHETICSISSYPYIYVGAGLSSLFMLLLAGVFLPINPIFIPKEFVDSLFRPPQRHP